MHLRVRKTPAKPSPTKPKGRTWTRRGERVEGLDLRQTGEPYPIRVGGRYRIEVEPTIEVAYKKTKFEEKLKELKKDYPELEKIAKEHPESIEQIVKALEESRKKRGKEAREELEVNEEINKAFAEIEWSPFDLELGTSARDTRVKTPETLFESWKESLKREMLSFQASLAVQEQYINRLQAEIKHRRGLKHYLDLLHFGPFPIPRLVTWVREWKLWKRRELARARKNLENNKRLTQAWNNIVNTTIKSLEETRNKFKKREFDPDPIKNAELCVREFQRILRLHNDNVSTMRYLLLGKPYLIKHKKQVGKFGTIELSPGFHKALNMAKEMDKKRSRRVLFAAGEEHSRRKRRKLVGSPA